MYTQMRSLRLTRGPYRQWKRAFFPHSGNKSNKYLNGPENICIFQLSINSAIHQKVKNTVDAGCGGTDPVKLQCTP